MRKLAREAVIFGLVGALIVALIAVSMMSKMESAGVSFATSIMAGLLYGFPGGLGIWVLYRLVRFAVRG